MVHIVMSSAGSTQVMDCAEPGTLEVGAAADILQKQEFEGEDEWPTGEPEPPGPGEGPSESEVSISDRPRHLNCPSSTSSRRRTLACINGSFTRPIRTSSRRFPMATRALTTGGSSTPIEAGFIKRTGRVPGSRAGRSLPYGTTRSFALSRPQEFNITWLHTPDMYGLCHIR